jgi:hypothetical protein
MKVHRQQHWRIARETESSDWTGRKWYILIWELKPFLINLVIVQWRRKPTVPLVCRAYPSTKRSCRALFDSMDI